MPKFKLQVMNELNQMHLISRLSVPPRSLILIRRREVLELILVLLNELLLVLRNRVVPLVLRNRDQDLLCLLLLYLVLCLGFVVALLSCQLLCHLVGVNEGV